MNKNKVHIYITNAGGGNFTTGKALQAYLNKMGYDAIIINFYKEIFKTFESVFLAETMYNFMLKYNLFRLINLYVKLCIKLSILYKHSCSNKLQQFFDETKPSMVISIIGGYNYIIEEVCRTNNVPFYLFCTDIDISNYICRMSNTQLERINVITDIGSTIEQKNIISKINNVKPIGIILREQFYEEKNKLDLKLKYNIDQNDFVIMIMMGSLGANNIIQCVKALKLPANVHLLIMTGYNSELKNCLNDLPQFSGTSKEDQKQQFSKASKEDQKQQFSHSKTSLIEYTEKISDLMAITDLLITKPGGLTIFEGIHFKIPFIFDRTNGLLFWEEVNGDYVVKSGGGIFLESYEDLNCIVNKFIDDISHYNSYKKSISCLKPKDNPLDSFLKMINNK